VVDITEADIITEAVEGITAGDSMPVMSPVRMARPTRQESTAAPSGEASQRTANWLAASNDRWVVPIGGGIGKLFRLGKLPVNTQLTAYSNVVKPRQSGADWQLRFQVQFLFPK
jgi:hypothetical protein